MSLGPKKVSFQSLILSHKQLVLKERWHVSCYIPFTELHVSSKSSLFLTLFIFGLNVLPASASALKESKTISYQASVVKKVTAQPVAVPPTVTALNVVTPAKVVAKSLTTVKSYKEWKNEKVQSAIKKVTITKAQIEYKKLNKQIFQKTEAGLGKDIDMEKLENQLKSDLFSLDAAQMLSVQDYFAIYLTKLENKNEAFKEAAQKMNSDEVAELINAFAESMVGSQGTPATAPSASADLYDDIAK